MLDRNPAGDGREMLAGYAVLAVCAGVVLGAVALVVQSGRDRPFDAVLLLAGALAVAFGWQMLLRATPAAPPLAPRTAPANSESPPTLLRAENAVAFSVSRAVDAYMLLRPMLREVAAERLSGYGVDLDTDARAPVMLGPWAWALLRPDLPEPDDWYMPGLHTGALQNIVEALERL